MTATGVTPITGTANWAAYAACKWKPGRVDLWFSSSPDHQRRAAHICLNHCPVFAQCNAERATSPCGYSVHAGILYGARWLNPQPTATQPNPDAVRCRRCGTRGWPVLPQPKTVTHGARKPATRFDDCGERKGYQRHLRRGEEPCEQCADADRRWRGERKSRAREQQKTSQKRRMERMGDAAKRAAWTERVRSMAADGMCDAEIGAELGLTKRQVQLVRQANDIPSGFLIASQARRAA